MGEEIILRSPSDLLGHLNFDLGAHEVVGTTNHSPIASSNDFGQFSSLGLLDPVGLYWTKSVPK